MNWNNNLSEMKNANRRMKLLLDSMGQAVLIFGPDGICQNECSTICEDVLEVQPSGMHISDVLKVPDLEKKNFTHWINLVFAESHDFKDLATLAPHFFKHSHGKWISLEYHEARDKDGSLTGVILVATDKTNEQRAQKDLKKQIEYTARVDKILRYKSQFHQYIHYLLESLLWLTEITTDEDLQEDNLGKVKRTLHNLKGATSTFFLNDLQDIIHQAENIIAAYSESPNPIHLREFRFYISEMEIYVKMFLSDNELLLGEGFGNPGYLMENHWSDLENIYHKLVEARVPNDLTSLYLKTLMSKPISECLKYLNSSLQLAAERLGKRCFPIVFKGEDILVMEKQYSGLFQTFIHFANNAATHGIELPTDRKTLGKPVSGKLIIISHLFDEENQTWLHIQFIDDGQGITAEEVRKKMEQKGKVIPEDWSDEQVIQLIFDPGFSTSEKVDYSSGQGIGLNSIQQEAIRLGGSASVSSEKGKGTTFTVKVPYIYTLPTPPQKEETAA